MTVVLVSLIAGVLQSGCSVIFVERAPANYADRPSFRCTTSHVAPIIDSVFSGLQLLALSETDDKSAEFVATAATMTGVYVASAVYGYWRVSECREAQASLAARVRDEHEQLQRYREFKLTPPPLLQAPPPPANAPAEVHNTPSGETP